MLKVDCTVELNVTGFNRVIATKTILLDRDYVGNQKDSRVLAAVIADELEEEYGDSIEVERILSYHPDCVDCGMRLVSLTDRCECFGQEVAA